MLLIWQQRNLRRPTLTGEKPNDQKATTLILGAGASVPFGLPTGYELLRQVINWADTNPGRTNPNLFSNFNKTEIDEFRGALRRSGKTSVDAFLEHRPEFIPVGKLAMPMAPIQYGENQILNLNFKTQSVFPQLL